MDGAAADFIEHDQAARRGGVQNDGGLGHLHHERGTAAREIVGRADAREDAIDDGQHGRVGGNEASPSAPGCSISAACRR